MRHLLSFSALVTVLFAAACSDASTGTPRLTNVDAPMAQSLASDIDQMVADFFPKGLETATGAKWETVQQKLASGDVAGARKHLLDLSKFIQLKTNDISAPAGETQQHAGARLVLAMAAYVFGGPAAPTPQPGPDVVVVVVPAGQAATIITPAQRAAVDLETGSTNEDRIISISQEPILFLEQCSGPLPTTRCQYPLFYRFESFPKLALNKVGRFATCMVTSGPRRPLDYTEGENTEEVHDRLRLAHNKPESEADYTPGSTIIEGIEVLPKAETQRGDLITCEGVVYPPVVVAARGGWLGIGERALYAVANFAGWLLTPKNLYAWDSGPEHDSRFFSNFNGVDPESQPDLAVASFTAPSDALTGSEASVTYVIENTSRRSGGEATGTSQPTTATLYLSSDAILDNEDAVIGTEAIGALPPDANQSVLHEFVLPTVGGSYHLIAKVDQNAAPFQPDVSLANNSVSHLVVVRDPTGLISGTVRNAFTNATISGATVTAGDASATSNTDGNFTISGVTAGTGDVIATAAGFNSATRSGVTVISGETTEIGNVFLSPIASGADIRVVLDWGDTSDDLDLHLAGPTGEGRFHLYWADGCYPTVGSFSGYIAGRGTWTCPEGTIASLDADDIQDFGPEAITLKSQIAGTYSYYVHNYSGQNPGGYSGVGPLTTSSATVRVFRGAELIAQFAVPTSGSGFYWHVFNLSGGGEITAVNTLGGIAPLAAASLVAGGSTTSPNDLERIDENVRRQPKTQP